MDLGQELYRCSLLRGVGIATQVTPEMGTDEGICFPDWAAQSSLVAKTLTSARPARLAVAETAGGCKQAFAWPPHRRPPRKLVPLVPEPKLLECIALQPRWMLNLGY